ncbi:nucleoside hydrolase [Xanthomonadaceae bacterium JHOS43]|nr:nucleoside hydrolase [Xanthomonadaceae bacterium JHOS43]MCX7562980.1 nucleoside hydrolase [Xanthomonadaceae bacterium XH05]
MTHHLLIDTDPGVDDALAILMAHTHPDARIAALTVTAGNVGLHHTLSNALKLCEVAGIDAPVFPGAPLPLVATPEDAAYVHGRDGFGDTGYTPATREAETEHAALAMLRLSRERDGELTFVMLGPLTNLALALSLDPTLPQRVPRLIIMGGAVTGLGNTRIPVEFNTGFDPEAARIVFERWPEFELVDWEATLRHGLPHEKCDRWFATNHPLARFYNAISTNTRAWAAGLRGNTWHSADALAMAQVLEPGGALEVAERAVSVELGGQFARGMTVVDWAGRNETPANARILMRYDQARFEALVQCAVGAG